MELRKKMEIAAVFGVVAALVALSVLHKGVPATHVDLNDGGVWVINQQARAIAHLNYPSRTLDGGLRASAADFDVSQSGNTVMLTQDAEQSWQGIDTAQLILTGQLGLDPGFRASQGGSTVAVAQAEQGKVWAFPASEASAFTPESEPQLLGIEAARVVVTSDGTALAIAGDGAVTALVPTGDGYAKESRSSLKAVPGSSNVDLTAVGQTPVALDRGSGKLITPAAVFDVPEAATAKLQISGPSADQVLVATSAALVEYPLGGGDPVVLKQPEAGSPAAPVLLEGCVYAAWATSGRYLRDCPGIADDAAARYDQVATAKALSFRVNRDVIVLNDDYSGITFLVREGMAVVNNWDQILNDLKQKERQDDTQTDADQTQSAKRDPSQQRPPVAVDDRLGVRAGTATSLPVLLNDSDEDGDVLTVTDLKQSSQELPVRLAQNGRAVRVDVPADATGTFQFSYRAFDGREKSANTATATVTIRTGNEAPALKRKPSIVMAERTSTTYSVLPNWLDPDGDQIYLDDAFDPKGLMNVTFRQDGTVSLKDLGTGGPGLREITMRVSDGSLTTDEVLRVQVRPAGGNLPPTANDDFVTVAVGDSALIEPLANDTDPNGNVLTLGDDTTKAASGQRITKDLAAGTLRFSSDRAGSFVIEYRASDGPSWSDGKVRIDVVDPKGKSEPPSAENDLALLPAGSSVLVDALVNDSDPLGNVLVIQQIDVPTSSGLTVEVLDRSMLRVSAPAGLDKNATFTYTISNGTATATARVLVIPMAAAATRKPPVAKDDEIVVRAGDIGTVSVLANDYSPSNLDLTLLPSVEVATDKAVGDAFVSADTVRFRAGDKPGVARLTYTLRDSAGNPDSATVKVTVVGLNQSNQLPVPLPITARVMAGGEVRIPVPLNGIDRDGDMVQLDSVTSAPSRGTVEVDGGYLTYRAPAGARGTDTFSYRVRDRFGGTGDARVRVGIAPRPDVNQSPVAVADERSVRPGRIISIAVTANDVDPDGDRISLVATSVVPVDGATTAPVTVQGQRLNVEAPTEPATLRYYYDIVDGNGGRARGVLIVKVDPNVPLTAPVAVDDYLSPTAIQGKTEVPVDVLMNDSDPDGSITTLAVSVDAPARVEGGQVVVPVTDDRQVILYTVTDPDGQVSRAAILVPGANQVPPTLKSVGLPLTVKGGSELTIRLDDVVQTRKGRSAIITQPDKVIAGPAGDSAAPAVVNEKTITFTPDKGFVGDTSVSFEATDGSTVEDPTGLVSTLTVPIRVESSGLFPPTLRPSEITVAPGEQASSTDLSAMVTDPDPGDLDKMSYTLLSAGDKFTVRVDGKQLLVSTPGDTPAGTKQTARIKVSDGSSQPVEMAVPLRVITSTRPLIQTTDVTVNDARAGEPSTVDLTNSITNPFADTGAALTITSTKVTSGKANVSVEGLRVTTTPDASFDGQVVVTYTVQDATHSTARQATGVIRLTVKGIPDAPTNVTATTQFSKSATVRWTAGDLRGGTLKTFTVSWSSGSKACGVQTVCELTNLLKNNQKYTFRVTQTTEVSESKPSAQSNEVRPDVKPNPPTTPTVEFGDGELSLSWQDGGGDGSKTESYTVQISPAAGGRTQQVGITGTSFTWKNLTNGTPYRFQVRAHNKAEDPSDWSGWSSPEIPAGQPSETGAPHVDKDAASDALPRARVSWDEPADPNGDSSFTYELRRSGTSAVLYSGPGNSTTINLSVSTSQQTFEVRVTNKSKKWSGWSSPSNAVRGFQKPGKPGGFKLEPTGQDNTAKFSFSAADGNGASASEIRYRWSAGGDSGYVTDGQSVTSGAFRNGSDVTVSLTAISTVQSETAEGAPVSDKVNAFGQPRTPSVSAEGRVNDVVLSWNASDSANGRSIAQVQIDTTDGGTQNVGTTGSTTQGNGRNQTKTIRARVQDSTGEWSDWAERSASTWPSPTASWTNSGVASGSYYWANVTLRHWNPNSTVYCSTRSTVNGLADYSENFGVDGNGNWGTGRTRLKAASTLFDGSALADCVQR